MMETLVIPEYGPDGGIASVLLADPEDKTQWLRAKLDALGRISELTESHGAQFDFKYDRSGRLAVAQSKNPGWVRFSSNAHSVDAKTSWGHRETAKFDEEGRLKVVESQRSGKQYHATFADGMLETIRGFDGTRAKFFRTPNSGGEQLDVDLPGGLQYSVQASQHGLESISFGSQNVTYHRASAGSTGCPTGCSGR